MFAKIDVIFVSILLTFRCLYLRDGKFAQLSYNFMGVSCHYMNASFYTYSDTYSFCLSRKYYTQYVVFSSQYFPVFLLIFCIFFPIFLVHFWKIFPIFFNASPGRPAITKNNQSLKNVWGKKITCITLAFKIWFSYL